MSVLLYGYGSMGKRYARIAGTLGYDVNVYDPNVPAAEMDGHVTRCLVTPQACKKSKPDSIIIAAPASMHAEIHASWAGSGIPMLVEKPLALSVHDFWKPQKTMHYGAVVVAYNLRFHPHIWVFREALNTLHGRPETWRAIGRIACDWKTWPGKTYADTLLECSHEIDLAAYLLGRPICYDATVSSNTQTWSLMMRCGETLTQLNLCTEQEGYERWFGVTDSDERQVWWGWHVPSGKSVLIRPDLPDEGILYQADHVYATETKAFLERDWEHFCTVRQGLQVLDVCDRARRLARRLNTVA